MKAPSCFMLCLLVVYVKCENYVIKCDNIKILKNLLHPPQTSMTLAQPVVPTYNKYYNNENEHQNTPPNLISEYQPLQPFQDKHTENLETKESKNILSISESGVFSSINETTQTNNNFNNQEANNTFSSTEKQLFSNPSRNDHQYTQGLPLELTTATSFQNMNDYETKTLHKPLTYIPKEDLVSSNNNNLQQPLNSNDEQELTNNGEEPNISRASKHSNIPEEEYQPPIYSNFQQEHNISNQFERNTSDETSSSPNKHQLSDENNYIHVTEIPFQEGGPIVFPTEPDTEAPARKYVKDDGNKGPFYVQSTTSRTEKIAVPVPDDGGRVVINAPSICPEGSRWSEGACRKKARK